MQDEEKGGEVVVKNFRIRKDLDDFLAAEAEKRGNSVTAMYRQALYEWMIERIKKENGR